MDDYLERHHRLFQTEERDLAAHMLVLKTFDYKAHFMGRNESPCSCGFNKERKETGVTYHNPRAVGKGCIILLKEMK